MAVLHLAVSQDTWSQQAATRQRYQRDRADGLTMQLNQALVKLFGLQAGVHHWHDVTGTWLQCWHPLCVEARRVYYCDEGQKAQE
jgi:hypothetical protein